MATILRTVVRQGRSWQVIAQANPLRIIAIPLLRQTALISTSKKNKDVGGTVQPIEKSEELKRLTEHFADTDDKKEENWISYGYRPGDRDKDWFYHHLLMFFTISIGICWGGFILAYMPDYKFHDWCHREAYLELERRERQGLPLVDPEYADPKTMELPSDEEIGDQEVII